jgi:hypothetical protein
MAFSRLQVEELLAYGNFGRRDALPIKFRE